MENKELKKLQRKVLRKLNYLSDLYDKHNNITNLIRLECQDLIYEFFNYYYDLIEWNSPDWMENIEDELLGFSRVSYNEKILPWRCHLCNKKVINEKWIWNEKYLCSLKCKEDCIKYAQKYEFSSLNDKRKNNARNF